jgi:hypothetical protein
MSGGGTSSGKPQGAFAFAPSQPSPRYPRPSKHGDTVMLLLLRLPLALFAAALACSFAAPAQAQAPRDRVFVASYGTDTGNTTCSFEAPCRTFQNAVNNVAVGGEVTAIDSAGFGQISITQSVTITSPKGVEAGIVAPVGANTIDINGSNIIVVLRGLTLEGNGISGSGINFLSGGGELQIIGCKIHNFVDEGIVLQPDASSGTTSVLIKDTVISDNFIDGISLATRNYGTLQVALDEVIVNNNGIGIAVNTAPSAVELMVSNSHIDNNKTDGLSLQGGTGALATAVLKNVTINETTGMALKGYADVWLSQVTQTTAPGVNGGFGLTFSGSNNAAYSDGTNQLMGGYGGGASLQSWSSQ